MTLSERVTHILSSLLGGLLVLLFIWGEAVGVYHAAKKHDELWLALSIPPLAWFRSIEIFWHDDFKGLNWEEENRSMAKISKNLLDASCKDEVDKVRLNESITSFAQRYSSYPTKRKEFVREFAHVYIGYQENIFADFVSFIKKSMELNDISFAFSEETIRIQNILINKFYLKDEIEIENETLKKPLVALFRDQDKEKMKENFDADIVDLKHRKDMNSLKEAYRKMYGESFRAP